MAMWNDGKSRNATHETLRKVLERDSNFLPNVLVIGSDGARRKWVARMFHAASFQNKGAFTVLRCKNGSQGPKSEFLNLFFALTRDGECPCSRTSTLLWGRTLFIDEVEQMDSQGQRLCLEFLKQLQRFKNERPGEVGLRVIAGVSKDLSDSVTQGSFLPGLLDLLDKVRIELDPAGKKKIETTFPKRACAGVEA
ncbi:MAG: sigma 54-interacting transcriptional regulator [Candidatus Eisenbacteria bacterium]|nr:sigma 54-interacting transcriptional regulator [Candidatus Eisenbacteria bacterium]